MFSVIVLHFLKKLFRVPSLHNLNSREYSDKEKLKHNKVFTNIISVKITPLA